jgi:hypothetical protein
VKSSPPFFALLVIVVALTGLAAVAGCGAAAGPAGVPAAPPAEMGAPVPTAAAPDVVITRPVVATPRSMVGLTGRLEPDCSPPTPEVGNSDGGEQGVGGPESACQLVGYLATGLSSSCGWVDQQSQPLANVTVSLLDAGTDGEFDTFDDVTQTTTTDGDGRYRFGALKATGAYKISVPGGVDQQQVICNSDSRSADSVTRQVTAEPAAPTDHVFGYAP